MTARLAIEIVAERYGDGGKLLLDWHRNRLAQRITAASDCGQRLDAITEFYAYVEADLMAQPAHLWAHGAYPVDWHGIFTPIESALWEEMLNVGAVFYPQFPIGRFFADFANPVARVAIECDGKEFHLDREADERRQAEIEAMGWTVYRISGRDCLIHAQEVLDDEGTSLRFESPGSRFIDEIAKRHRLARRFCQDCEEHRVNI
jgi:very-short-patch-repair endonuclease